ncbi:MAG: sigma-E factor negative regulatory protein [Burkholderiales bacterium]|jgi:negative regulator of sigma E activity|nr:sigma-E factor negative regulatory protein [Burkholderiales bacterium]
MVTKRLTDEAAMREKISQWMDGEADGDVESSVYAALKSDAGRDTWALYHHVGDTLRDGAQCGAVSAGFTARVMEALAAEPTVLVPQAVAPRKTMFPEARPYYRAWALAAMVTGAAVVGWMAFALQDTPIKETVSSEAVKELVVTTASLAATQPMEMSTPPDSLDPEALIPVEYLMTHQEFLPAAPMLPGINAYQWIDDAGRLNLDSGL